MNSFVERERIAKIRSGADRIILLDEHDEHDNAVRELRTDIESLKSDVQEMKAMLNKLNERD